MLFSRSILLAAASFATLASAIPTPDLIGDVESIAGGITGKNLGSGIGNDVPTVVSEPPVSEVTDILSSLKRGASQSPGDSFQKCLDDIAPIIVEIGQYHIYFI